MIPHGADREACLVQPRRVRHNAIEVFGEALSFDQSLSSAVGARIPVSVGDGLPVVVLGNVPGSCGREVYGTIGIVGRLLRIAQDEGSAGLFAGIVSCVGLREGESQPQSAIALRNAARVVQSLARMAAVADHVEASIPFCRQAHLEGDLRRKHSGDTAVGRRRLIGSDHRRVDLCNVPRLESAHGLAGLARFCLGSRIVHKSGFQFGESLSLRGKSRSGNQDRDENCLHASHGVSLSRHMLTQRGHTEKVRSCARVFSPRDQTG